MSKSRAKAPAKATTKTTSNSDEEDSSMMGEYFQKYKEYKNKFGEKMFLLWQCGSFFEVYGIKKDGITANQLLEYSRILECRVVKKGKYNNQPLEMTGFTTCKPLQKYVPKLLDEGYTVVVWEEYGEEIVKKRKVRLRREKGIFSPSTNIDSSNRRISNYCCVVWIEKYDKDTFNKFPYFHCGVALIDNFTGKSKLFEFRYENNNIHNSTAFDELDRIISIYNPSETIFIHNYEKQHKIDDIVNFIDLNSDKIHMISLLEQGELNKQARNCENEPFQKAIFENVFNIPDYNFFMKNTQMDVFIHSTYAYCFLLNFITQHNKQLLKCISEPVYEKSTDSVYLATHCLKQLNIINTEQSTNNKYSSVLNMMNRCKTAMGRRKMKDIILHPSTNIAYLNNEYQIIEHIIDLNNISPNFIDDTRKNLINIHDIEKIYRKIILNIMKPSELVLIYYSIVSFRKTCDRLLKDEDIYNYIHNKTNGEDIIPSINTLISLFEETLIIDNCNEDPKTVVNIFNRGLYEDLDLCEKKYIEHKQQLDTIQQFLTGLIKDPVRTHSTEKYEIYMQLTSKRCEKLKKSIEEYLLKYAPKGKEKNLLLSFNSDYDGKKVTFELDLHNFKYSTGTSGNKKITSPLLNQLYISMMQDVSNLKDLMKIYFNRFNNTLKTYYAEFTNIITNVSNVDIVFTKSYLADKNNYCRPVIENQYEDVSYFKAKNIRHALIEHINKEEAYVPNDVSLTTDKNGILLYGTNAVGKSSLIKSIGISIILAQAGMFVPCSELTYYPYTSIFTRILGNDNIFKGLSTFAVEMCELRTILSNCCENSLVLGDELCSGTEIDSAVSLFASGVNYLCNKKSSFIFATHFHELIKIPVIQDLLSRNLIMYHMSVQYDKSNDVLVYKRKLEKGSGEGMYGLEVCKSLNMPDDFIDLAYTIRISNKNNNILTKNKSKYNSNIIKNQCGMMDCENMADDIHHLNPQEYANKKGRFKDKWFHKNHSSNLIPICKSCHNNITKNKIVHRKTKTSKGMALIEE
jgi:DNA mismatch repair protein MutS